jgi:uncharacterized alkaline shock family protein YloU
MLRIAENVVASVAELAVRELDGIEEIVRVGEKQSYSWLTSAFKKKLLPKHDSPVQVKVLGDVVEVTVAVILSMAIEATAISEDLQNAVKSSVQNMTGVTVARVNVKIAGMLNN